MNTDHAVVLGGSVAGLLAARALSDTFDQVTVLERDALPASTGHRRGTPQTRHIHALMARGQVALEELFPGFTADLCSRGAPLLDQLRDARLVFSGHRLAHAESGVHVLSVSRPCLEDYLRERVRRLPGVEIADRCDVAGLGITDHGRRVTGVRILRRKDDSAGETLDADLVVDAMGRGSRVPRWLEESGLRRPDEDRITARIGYSTAVFSAQPGALGRHLAVIVAPTPTSPRGGALATLEGGRWIVTLQGMLGDRPPTDLCGFRSFAQSLHVPDLAEAIRDADLLEEPAGHQFPASVRRRYEKVPLPEGLLVLGDGLCSFNPIYGQGMAVAALEADALRRDLRPGDPPATRAIQRRFARTIDVPWTFAAGGDLAFPDVLGTRTATIRLANAYVPRLHAAAADDPALATIVLRVGGMLDHPRALMHPRVVGAVLRHAARRPADAA